MLAQYDGLVEGYLAAAGQAAAGGVTGRVPLSREDLLFLHSNGEMRTGGRGGGGKLCHVCLRACFWVFQGCSVGVTGCSWWCVCVLQRHGRGLCSGITSMHAPTQHPHTLSTPLPPLHKARAAALTRVYPPPTF
jgi:hypothetical protein